MPEIAIPYDKIDNNILSLVCVLNDLEGITTGGSCGGHANPRPDQQPESHWNIVFLVDHTEDGWYALEFLSWICHGFQKTGAMVSIVTVADDAFLNLPVPSLGFSLYGINVDPEEFAGKVGQLWREHKRRITVDGIRGDRR